ncbi:MAG TPA: hemerythrin domain-containing protein [Gaiellaceae bacterium]|jgi:hemerythrin-like domain-containing protein
MKTTYFVNWQAGSGSAVAGVLEVKPAAIVFTPADGGAVAAVPLADVQIVRVCPSTVELDRQSGDPISIESVAAGALGTSLDTAVKLAETLRSLRSEHHRIDEELGDLRVAVDCLADLTNVRGCEIGLLATDLMRRVVHHGQVEERELYPAVARLLGCESLVEAMLFDHRAIEGEVRDLIHVDSGDPAGLACVFHRLDALLTTHIAKEEAIVFPLLELG